MLTNLTPLLLLLLILKPNWNQSIIFITVTITVVSPIILKNFIPAVIYKRWALDHISMILIILTLWIIPLVIAARQNIYTKTLRPSLFISSLLVLTLILVTRFHASHLFSFYILFEASLIPTLVIIIKWGYQPERLQARIYLLLYTVTASLPLLAGIALVYHTLPTRTFFLPLYSPVYHTTTIWLLLNLAFIVKLPTFFFGVFRGHIWII